MASIDNYTFTNKRALIRVDFNVPLSEDRVVLDDTRIRAAIPTIQWIIKQGGKVVLMSHLGRPKNGYEEKYSMKHVVSCLESLLGGKKVIFCTDSVGENVEGMLSGMSNGDVALLENLRFYNEEKAGDTAFAEQLSKLGDVYVNDAFGTAHRAHASTAIIAQYFEGHKMFGYLIENELDSISQVMKQGQKPFTAIVGGAKVSSKIEIIKQLMDNIDHLIIGGGMTYTFAKALGGAIGSSLVEENHLSTANEILELAKANGVKLHLPVDSVVADGFSNDANTQISETANIAEGWMGLDIGENSIVAFEEVLKNSKTILWNGPMGVFEMSKFEKGTKRIAEAVASATDNGAYSLIGGGDSVAAINKYGLKHRVSYVSTGGGALLEFIEGKALPGIEAILN